MEFIRKNFLMSSKENTVSKRKRITNAICAGCGVVGMGCSAFGLATAGLVFLTGSNLIKNASGFFSTVTNEQEAPKKITIQEYLRTECELIDNFSPHDRPTFYLSFVHYLFEPEDNRKVKFVKDGDDGVSVNSELLQNFIYRSTGANSIYQIPDQGIVYFKSNPQSPKFFVKFNNFSHFSHLNVQIFVPIDNLNGIVKIYSDLKGEISKQYKEYLIHEKAYTATCWDTIKLEFIEEKLQEKDTRSDNTIEKNKGENIQNYVIDKILQNKPKIEKNEFTTILLLGKNNVGKSYCSKLIADRLEKKLFIIPNNIKKNELTKALSQLQHKTVIDISDIGHSIYTVETKDTYKTWIILNLLRFFYFILMHLENILKVFDLDTVLIEEPEEKSPSKQDEMKIQQDNLKTENEEIKIKQVLEIPRLYDIKKKVYQLILKTELSNDRFSYRLNSGNINNPDLINDGVIRGITDLKMNQTLVIVSANKPFFNFYRCIPGFLKRVSLIIDFDATDESKIEIPNLWNDEEIPFLKIK